MTAAKGVSGTVDGTMIMVGELIGELNSADKARVDEQLSKGATVVYVHADGKPAGFIALSDVMREDAANTVQKLKAVGITPMLLTGDNASALPVRHDAEGNEEDQGQYHSFPCHQPECRDTVRIRCTDTDHRCAVAQLRLGVRGGKCGIAAEKKRRGMSDLSYLK